MDKLFIKEKTRRLEQKLNTTKQEMRTLFEELVTVENIVSEKTYNKVIVSTIKRLYEQFKNKSPYFCSVGLSYSDSYYKKADPVIIEKVIRLKKLLDDNSTIFTINPDNYYNYLLDSEPVCFEGDIVITDPCYLIKEGDRDDWHKAGYGDELNELGFSTFMARDTIYGDWSCTVYDINNSNAELGQFCADSGRVCVVLLDDIQRYNPNFESEYLNKRNWCATSIKNFKGTVQFVVKRETYEYEGEEREDFCVEVIGTGVDTITNEPINFRSSQTGF